MMRTFLTIYAAQKIVRMTFGAIFGLAQGMKNKSHSTDINIIHEKSRKKYQGRMGGAVTDEKFKEFVRKNVDDHQSSLSRLASERVEFKCSSELLSHLDKSKKVCQAAFTDLGLMESNLIIHFYNGSHLGASVSPNLKFIGDIPVYRLEIVIPKDQQFDESFFRRLYAIAGHEAIHTTQLVAQDTITCMRQMSFAFAFPLIFLHKEESDELNFNISYSIISKLFEIDADVRSAIRLKTAADLKEHMLERIPPDKRNESGPRHPSPAIRIKYLNIISKFQEENSSLFFKSYQDIKTSRKDECLSIPKRKA